MQHMKNRAIREQLYRAYITRASEVNPATNNCEIIKRILEIKYELAQLLGYSCHAEKSLRRKMASNIDSVNNLIAMLREKSYPAAQRELAELEAYAKAHGFQSTDGKLALWDVPYWSERLREASYQYSEEELRPYFALPNVLNGLFQLANRLFGIRIVPAKLEQEGIELWHDDVQFFHVYETNPQTKQEEHIASFYLDPYSRPAEKRGGAWMNTCIGKSKVLGKKPVAYLICNGSPPVAGKPSLMSFREVETLFHEFGHGLQHMLTRVDHADAAGSKSFCHLPCLVCHPCLSVLHLSCQSVLLVCLVCLL
jgi:oligopeptidase A